MRVRIILSSLLAATFVLSGAIGATAAETPLKPGITGPSSISLHKDRGHGQFFASFPTRPGRKSVTFLIDYGDGSPKAKFKYTCPAAECYKDPASVGFYTSYEKPGKYTMTVTVGRDTDVVGQRTYRKRIVVTRKP